MNRSEGVKQTEGVMSDLQGGLERDQFERELTLAMRHVDAPHGFADRVLAKVAQPEVRRTKVLMMPWRIQAWAGSAIAAALLVGAFGVRQQREHRERAKEAAQAQQQFDMAVQIAGQTLAEAHAQQQFEVAMQITGDTLANVREQLQQSGIQLGD